MQGASQCRGTSEGGGSAKESLYTQPVEGGGTPPTRPHNQASEVQVSRSRSASLRAEDGPRRPLMRSQGSSEAGGSTPPGGPSACIRGRPGRSASMPRGATARGLHTSSEAEGGVRPVLTGGGSSRRAPRAEEHTPLQRQRSRTMSRAEESARLPSAEEACRQQGRRS